MLLVYTNEKGKETSVRVNPVPVGAPITIGRDQSADITVKDSECSRIHAGIRYWTDVFAIRDMGSANGTLLNDEKIEIAIIRPGDIIKIGGTEIRAEAEDRSRPDVTARVQN